MKFLLTILSLVAAVWVIYHVWSKNHRLSDVAKIIWTVAAILFSVLTAIVYYIVERPEIRR
jgi:hypothetical protein